MALDKLRAGAQIEWAVPDTGRNQAGILEHADPNNKVEPLFDQMDAAVLEIDINHHIGIGQRIFGNGLAQKQLAKGHRHIQPQPAGRPLLFRGQFRKKHGKLLGIFRQQRVEAARGFGRLDIARGPVEQPKAKPFFQQFDLLACRRTGNAEGGGRSSETAMPDHFPECLDRRIENHYQPVVNIELNFIIFIKIQFIHIYWCDCRYQY